SAACGGHTDRIISASAVSRRTVRTSVRPASLALTAVSGPRASEAHSTRWPAPVRHRPTAAPISPGCSSPITVALSLVMSECDMAVRPRPGAWPDRGLPGDRVASGRTRDWRRLMRGRQECLVVLPEPAANPLLRPPPNARCDAGRWPLPADLHGLGRQQQSLGAPRGPQVEDHLAGLADGMVEITDHE